MKKNVLAKVPLIAVAALPMTLGLVFAQTSANNAQAPQRVQPLQPGQQSQQGHTQQGQTQRGQQNGQRQQSGTNYADVFLQKLAAQLGISVDKLKAAAQAASKSTIDQGVKAGDFPADMAQNMTQRLQDNPFALAGGRGGHGGGRGGHGDGDFGGRGGRGGDFQGSQQGQQMGRDGAGRTGGARGGAGQVVTAAVAKALRLTEQQLFTQLQNGQTVAQLAQAKGISTATLHTAAVNALKTGLAAQVKAGRLTQAQADQMIAQAQADPNFGLNFGRGGRGNGGPRGQTDTQGDAITG